MTQGELEKIPLKVEQIFSNLEIRIMSDIVRRIKENGFSSASADWQITRLQQLGKAEDDIKQWIQEAMNASSEEMEYIFSDEAYKQYTGNDRAYKASDAKQIPFEENASLQSLIDATKRQIANENKNLANSMGFAIKNDAIFANPDPTAETIDDIADDTIGNTVCVKNVATLVNAELTQEAND